MSLCSLTQPQGLNQDCLAFISRADQLLIVESGTSFTLANLKAKGEFETAIKVNLKAYVMQLVGYDVTSEDATIETTQFGEKLVTSQPPPSMIAYAKLNPCDFRALLKTLKGGSYDVVFLNQDGSIMGWVDGANFYGFTARIWAINKGLPSSDNISQFYRLDFSFTNKNQFDEFHVSLPNYNPLTQLLAVMPNGLGVQLNSYDGTTAVVSVTKRCGDAFTGLGSSDFEIISQSGSSTISSVTDNSDGTYDLAIAMTTPAWMIIRIKKSSGATVTDISWNLTIEI